MRLNQRNAFTLIEIMIVVAVIAILASVAIPKFSDLVTKSKEASVKANLGSIRSALSIYYGNVEGIYPQNLADAVSLGAEYLPTTGGVINLGNFIIPKTLGNPGHSYPMVLLSDIQQGDGSTADDSSALYYVNSGFQWGEIFINCTHTDSKGLIWTSF